jgi:Protein of unknown function (DUF4019)
MKNRSLVFAVALFTFALASLRAGHAESDAADPAVEAQRSWLALVDAGKYDESWDAAGSYFRQAVTKESWRQMVKAARAPLGALRSRSVDSRHEASTLPGAPDGKYVIVQWKASFGNKAAAVETVTCVLEKDGKWRVIGYYVK